MAALDRTLVASKVSDLLSTSAISVTSGTGPGFAVRLLGLERPYGLQVRITEQLGRLEATLELDTLAGRLLQLLHDASDVSWAQFIALVGAVSQTTTSSEILSNSSPILGRPEGRIELLEIQLSKRHEDGAIVDDASRLIASVFSLILVLLPVDDDTSPVNDYAEEGARSRREINHYERSRSNRAIAIAVHGVRCRVCEFDFGDAYGPIGAGYVEVHHLEPVHAMEEARVVDPIHELVPLCANCHRMVHRRNPPLTPAELIGMRTGGTLLN